MSLSQHDPLRARLHDVEEEIRGRLLHVCKSPPPEDLDTGAMIRFEEDLSIVTSAAKEAVSLRRRLRVDRDGLAWIGNDGMTRMEPPQDNSPDSAA